MQATGQDHDHSSMRAIDRFAWRCSWLAPTCWLATLALFMLSLLPRIGVTMPAQWQEVIPGAAVISAILALAAHTVVGYHILKSRVFSSGERDSLWRSHWFGAAYADWRRAMRGQQG
jgi:hypothetical protein